jgi:Arc/MetJ-type ribon-helix-helix transcriptional regulator
MYHPRMTMLSFRVDESQVREVQSWAEKLGVDRSELLREALRRHLLRLASERDAETWQHQPLTQDELSLDAIENWAPAEDWADWADAAR